MSVTVLVFDGISPIRLDGLFLAICVGVPVIFFFLLFSCSVSLSFSLDTLVPHPLSPEDPALCQAVSSDHK